MPTHQYGHAPGLVTPAPDHICLDLAPLGACAAPPAGLSPHTKDNAAKLGSKGGAEEQKQANSGDCANHLQPEQPDEEAASTKRLATLRARLALAGWELAALPNGTHVVSRWGHARHCTSLDAVEAFAQQVRASA